MCGVISFDEHVSCFKFHFILNRNHRAGSRQAVYKSILGPIPFFYSFYPGATADIQAAAEQHIAAIFLAATDRSELPTASSGDF